MAENIKITKIETLNQMLSINARRYSLRKAFLYKDENGETGYISYRRFYRNVKSFGTALLKKLQLSGKKIALCAQNSYEWCVSYFAVCGSGNVVVPLDREIIFEEMLNVFSFAGIDAIIVDEKVAKRLMDNRDMLPENLILIMIGEQSYENFFSYNLLLAEGKSLLDNGCVDYENVEIDPDETAVLLFTSGTTGMAKAVMLSNRNICSDLMSVCERVSVNYDDSTLCILPLHHAYQSIIMLTVIYIGGSVSFCQGIRHISEDLNFYKPTVFVSVPLILEKMHSKIVKKLSEQSGIKRAFTVGKASALLAKISSNDVKKHLYSSVHEAFGGRLRMIIVGGAMMSAEIALDYEAFGFPVIIGYGLTECSPIIICNSSDDAKPDGIGKPVSTAKAYIDKPDENGVGEIVVSGPMVMLGYYNNEEETQKVLRDGWLYTGDLGYVDSERNYHITGRSKNIIVAKNGKNVYPEELEYYLNNEPMVLESLIFADSIKEDEVVTAEVVPDEQAIKDELQKEKLSKSDIHDAISSVIKRINRKLPSYKNIKRINIRENEFEKTSTQKIKRPSKNDK